MKHHCEDCIFMSLDESESKDIQFAKCHAAIQSEWIRMARLLRDESKITVSKYYYCTTERDKDTCENYKPKDLCDE